MIVTHTGILYLRFRSLGLVQPQANFLARLHGALGHELYSARLDDFVSSQPFVFVDNPVWPGGRR